jgi:hypothetical protein
MGLASLTDFNLHAAAAGYHPVPFLPWSDNAFFLFCPVR